MPKTIKDKAFTYSSGSKAVLTANGDHFTSTPVKNASFNTKNGPVSFDYQDRK